jgi:hypothetical protein
MKFRALWLSLLTVIVSAVLVGGAGSPTPTAKPAGSPSPNPSVSLPQPSFAPVPTPTPHPVVSPSEQSIAMIRSAPANAGPPPKPVLYLASMESFSAGGKNYIRLLYDVLNKADYPADMFAAAPTLPPCGLNHNASRTWVDFFDATGKRIYGFCALSKPEDLGKIWIAYEDGTIPPSYVYIELNDRQTNTKYKSNLADTTL